jgi:hypothetical protein
MKIKLTLNLKIRNIAGSYSLQEDPASCIIGKLHCKILKLFNEHNCNQCPKCFFLMHKFFHIWISVSVRNFQNQLSKKLTI